jgi:signal-induced proliferation-associated 1 like protein 1
VGIIYQRSEQNDEYDLFSNDHLSEELRDFLQLLADRVRLKGFARFRGDLDVKEDLHGEYSYYTQYHNHEMMFNVAPMIPSLKANGQCIERKGLVSNAFVCVIFQESDAEFSPEIISGKVTQVYITVRPMQINDELYFKVMT